MSSSSSADSSPSVSPETPAALYDGPAPGVYSLKYQAFWMAEIAKLKDTGIDEKKKQKMVDKAWLKQANTLQHWALSPAWFGLVRQKASTRAVDTLLPSGAYDLRSPVETTLKERLSPFKESLSSDSEEGVDDRMAIDELEQYDDDNEHGSSTRSYELMHEYDEYDEEPELKRGGSKSKTLVSSPERGDDSGKGKGRKIAAPTGSELSFLPGGDQDDSFKLERPVDAGGSKIKSPGSAEQQGSDPSALAKKKRKGKKKKSKAARSGAERLSGSGQASHLVNPMPRGLKEYHDFYMTESAKIKEEHPNMAGKSVQKKVHALWKASPDEFLRL
ncbi:hypothetical protein JCM1840_000530 [Sporobolomyces johnsonii]